MVFVRDQYGSIKIEGGYAGADTGGGGPTPLKLEKI
jgi:hypothetical protein